MKKLILILVLAISFSEMFAINSNDSTFVRPLNNINLNFFGDASIISVNYERLYFLKPGLFLSFKAGIGYTQEFQLCIFGPCESPPEDYITFPHHFTFNIGKKRHFFEFGLGGTIIGGNASHNYLIYPLAGYRLQPLKSKKLTLRVYGSIPITGLETEDIIFLPFGLSFGLSF